MRDETPAPHWPDLSGRLQGRRHVLPVRVYFEDTDAGGIVYHASYIRWFERGRSDFLRLLGLHHTAMMAAGPEGEGMIFVVRRITVDYLKPARLDDVLEIITEPGQTGVSSLTLVQEAVRADTTICRAEVVCVLISGKGKPLRLRSALPPELATFFNGAQQ